MGPSPGRSHGDPSARDSHVRRVAIAAFVVTAVVFAPAVRNEFVNYDDHAYVVENAEVLQGLGLRGVRWAFTTVTLSNYHPVTWLAHMLDVTCFGTNAAAHHAVSVFWHALNAALAVLVVVALTGRVKIAAATTALFALHPLRVESVAWVSERKDLLSGFFFLVCLLAYVRHRRTGVASWWGVAFVACALGLLAKPMLVTVPPLLVLLDVVVLGEGAPVDRARAALWRCLPFFLLSFVFVVLTLQTQADAMMDVATFPLATRLQNAPVNLARYLALTVWPDPLAAIYPVRPTGAPATLVIVALLVLGAVTALAARRARREPLLLLGWLWFVGMLVPVLGLFQAGRAAVADRYTYLPHLGLFLAVAVLAASVAARGPVVLAWASLAFVPRTLEQIAVWQDTRTLFAHSVRHEPESPFAQDALAGELLADGDVPAAVDHARVAVALAPDVPRYRERLGQGLAVAGQVGEAEQVLRGVLATHPDHASARFLLSSLLHQTQRDPEATAQLQRAHADAEAAGDAALLRRIRPILQRLQLPPAAPAKGELPAARATDEPPADEPSASPRGR
ncbi:MAG: hypothetical protein FJ137_08965 [Deltaproteobacteria bacterium]|nr:hypothetical protein [Deltaproteobacteria bacterium]